MKIALIIAGILVVILAVLGLLFLIVTVQTLIENRRDRRKLESLRQIRDQGAFWLHKKMEAVRKEFVEPLEKLNQP